jgi:hypothetical protein
MPATYEPIATTTLGSNATITFSSIPSGYTDLRLVVVGTTTNNIAGQVRVNGDTGTNYSGTYIQGTGTVVQSSKYSSGSRIWLNPDNGTSTTVPTMHTLDIFSYSGSTNKSCLTTSSDDRNGSGYVVAQVALWRSTSTITSITIETNGGTFATGTTATLYGILKA